jgi:Ca2+-binding RTX toxin-like protein
MASVLLVNGFNMDHIRLGDLLPLVVSEATDGWIQMRGPDIIVDLGGAFTYGSDGLLSGGTLTGFTWQLAEGQSAGSWPTFSMEGFSVPVPTMLDWLVSQDTNAALSTIFSGNDTVEVYDFARGGNLIRTYGGNDTVSGVDGDTVFGGTGNDVIRIGLSPTGFRASSDARNFLRGEEGNDSIQGGLWFNDINGNTGNDTIWGGNSADWLLGGQDNDNLSGFGGDDIMNGNLGSDTVDAGAGNDIVRGGQSNDLLRGGTGDDWISGDLGTDSLNGGTGADTFHFSVGSGSDWIFDFKRSEGDRILLDAGMTWTANQQGADVIVNISGGGQIVLSGVQMSSLTGDWIGAG